MKKLINGTPIKINTEFWEDYIYGKILQKITRSNIYDDIDKAPKEANDIIKRYKTVFDSLHFVMRAVESNMKYCVVGELMKSKYQVYDNTLYIKTKDGYISFKGEFWALSKDIPGEGVVFKDCSPLKNYEIYENYLKTNGRQFIKTNFTDLWEACDENELKLKNELDNILHFINIKSTKINSNEILDLDLNLKYNIIPTYAGTKKTGNKQMTIDIGAKSTSAGDEVKDFYTFSVYKQSQTNGASGSKVYGKEVLEASKFADIFEILNKTNENTVRGIKANNIIYYECNNNIFKSENGESDRIIKAGKIYGVKDKDLLIYHDKILTQNITKRKVYIMRNDILDVADVDFFVGGAH